MKIEIERLREAATRLFDHLESLGHATVDLEEDYYWVIDKSKLYDTDQQPTGMSLGQLYDDYDILLKVLRDDLDPISYHLTNLAPLLRYIGEKVAR